MSDLIEIVNKHIKLMDHSKDFHLILEILENSINISNSPVLEVGVNLGGSSLVFLETIKKNNKNNLFFTIDPYASIPYTDGGGTVKISKYNDKRYRLSMKYISDFCFKNRLNYQHFKITSDDFINYIYPNFIIYENTKFYKFDKFSFIFLDGSHDKSLVMRELDFFLEKIDINGSIVIDDIYPNIYQNFICERKNKNSFILNTDIKDRLHIRKV